MEIRGIEAIALRSENLLWGRGGALAEVGDRSKDTYF